VPTLGYLVTVLVAYLLGSIPTGYLVARAKGIDIRTVGSRNIGATNVFRVVGKPQGILVFLVDALKGYTASKYVAQFGVQFFVSSSTLSVQESFPVFAGFAAVLGHNYTCWLGFKGGKGMATSAGVLLALFPNALLAVFGIWLAVFALSRFVSLASIAAAFWLPVFVGYFDYSDQRILIALILAALAICKHKSNIERLIAGTEHRFGEKRPAPADAPPPAS